LQQDDIAIPGIVSEEMHVMLGFETRSDHADVHADLIQSARSLQERGQNRFWARLGHGDLSMDMAKSDSMETIETARSQ